jgi:hypothetical protein
VSWSLEACGQWSECGKPEVSVFEVTVFARPCTAGEGMEASREESPQATLGLNGMRAVFGLQSEWLSGIPCPLYGLVFSQEASGQASG